MNPLATFASSLSAQHARLATMLNHVIDEAITIQQIPSPTFDEGQRAAYVADRFRSLIPAEAVEVDSLHNVYGLVRGTDPKRHAVLLSAHTDTVFEASTRLDIQRQGTRIYGPGLGDNSLAVAALLTFLELLRDQHLPADIWFVANSREEGLGDLGGMRAVYEKLKSRLGVGLVMEGIALGRIYHAGIAVRRFKITCKTAGGHSWLHFGRPSAIHELVRLAAQITTLQPPTSPRTSFNIGVIEGGRSVNSIADDASMLLDMRSEGREALAALEQKVMAMIEAQRAASGPEVEFGVEVVGDRPAGSIPPSHPLVQLADESLSLIGIQPIHEAGSTDANVLLAAGLPTVTVGVTYGGNAHRMDEYIETAPLGDGLWHLLVLATAAASGIAQ